MFPPTIINTDADYLNNPAQGLSELAYLHATQLAILGSISTGSGGMTQTAPQTIDTVKRPWIDPPEGYAPFDEETSIALDVVGNSVTVVTFVVPDGFDGVINYFSWNFTGGGFSEGSGDLVVQITRNTTPIRNFGNILVEKGTVAIPRPISPIRIYSNQTIRITCNHVANALLTGNVVGSLSGYIYPNKS